MWVVRRTVAQEPHKDFARQVLGDALVAEPMKYVTKYPRGVRVHKPGQALSAHRPQWSLLLYDVISRQKIR